MDLEAQGERKGVTIEPDADWQTVITPRVSSPRAASQDGGRDAAASDGAPSSRARCDACDHCADVCSGAWPGERAVPFTNARATNPDVLAVACTR